MLAEQKKTIKANKISLQMSRYKIQNPDFA